MVAVGGNATIRRQHRAKSVMSRGAIEVVLKVVLARPDDLHRPLDLFRERRRLSRVVIQQPPTKATAGPTHVQCDLRRLEASDRCNATDDVSRDLRRSPQL